jgi:hypothetical protein
MEKAMTPQERDLIQAVFDRLARAGSSARDGEAEGFIRDQVRRQPDAAYGLTQAVIVLEAGLNQAQQKIADLQRQLDEARGGAATSSGFLGSSSPWGSGSVPRSAPAAPLQPAYAPQPAYAAPPIAPAGGPWAQPSVGGSFLRNAATMAAGVAGGTLIAEGISSLFGGHQYGGFGGGYGGGMGGPGIVEENVTVNNYYDDDRQGGGSGGDDPGTQDASYDDGGSFDDSSDFGTDV